LNQSLKPAFVLQGDWTNDPTKTLEDLAHLDQCFSDQIERPDLDSEDFARFFALALQRHLPDHRIDSVQGTTITATFPNGLAMQIDTVPPWEECKGSPGERKKILRPYLASFANQSLSGDALKLEDVVAIVRSDEYYNETCTTLGHSAGEKAPYCRAIAPGLVCMLAIDSPSTLQVLTNLKIDELKPDLDNQESGPIKRMLYKLPGPVLGFDTGCGIFMLACGGDYESSLILNNKIMGALKEIVQGDLLFSVPNRNMLLVTNRDHSQSVEELRARTSILFEKEFRPTSNFVYAWDDGKITKYR